MPYFLFSGHPPTKQSLQSEDEAIFIAGVPVWPRWDIREVTADLAEYLRQFRGTYGGRPWVGFVEMTGPDSDAVPIAPQSLPQGLRTKLAPVRRSPRSTSH